MNQAIYRFVQKIYEIDHSGHRSLRPMEGLRGFAVFLVFLVHFITLAEPWIIDTPTLYKSTLLVRNLGNMGVDLFFVLSGYLIYGSLIKKPQPFLPYLGRRIQRIYPTFTVVFAFYIALSMLFISENKLPAEHFSALVYLLKNYLLLPGIFDIPPLITVAWSLSYEFFFYLTIPVIIIVFQLRKWPVLARIYMFSLFGAMVLWFPELFHGHIRFAMFTTGILVFETVHGFKTVARPNSIIALTGIAGLILALGGTALIILSRSPGQLKFFILFISFYFLCLACFTHNGLTAKLFSWTPLRWLGNISYSYYLLHGLTLKFMFLVLKIIYPPNNADDILIFFAGLPAALLLTFFTATALFTLIEKPYSLSAATCRAANHRRFLEPFRR